MNGTAVLIWALLLVDCCVIFAIGRSVVLKSDVRAVWSKCAPCGWRQYPGVLVQCSHEVWRYLKDDSQGDQIVLIGSIIPVWQEAVWLGLFLIGIGLPLWLLAISMFVARGCLAIYFLNGRLVRALRLWMRTPS